MCYNLFGDIMSYYEYNEQYEKAQLSGNLKIYLLDIAGSRKMHGDIRQNATILSLQLLKNIYIKLNILENERKIEIIHRNPIFNVKDSIQADLREPFHVAGDSFGFTIKKNSLTDDEVYNIIIDEKNKLGIDFNYNISTAYYETDEYLRRIQEYYRGYCIAYLCFEKDARVKKL